MLASCDGSSADALAGLGDEFDIAALPEPGPRLCAEAECGFHSLRQTSDGPRASVPDHHGQE